MALIVMLALAAAYILNTSHQTAAASTGKAIGAGEAVRAALQHSGFRLLAAGFFVCGFHVALLATHLPGVVAACGLPAQYGGWPLAQP